MKLKHAILERLPRDGLKRICGRLEIEDVDRRSAAAMRAKLSRLRRASPEVMLGFLRKEEVKALAEAIGANTKGHKSQLIEALVAPGGSEQSAGNGRWQGNTARTRRTSVVQEAQQYRHKKEAIQRPDVGVQDQFQMKRPPKTYCYDSSLDPALSWDEQRERALGEWLIGLIERAAKDGEGAVFNRPQEWAGGGVRVGSTTDAVRVLKSISKPF